MRWGAVCLIIILISFTRSNVPMCPRIHSVVVITYYCYYAIGNHCAHRKSIFSLSLYLNHFRFPLFKQSAGHVSIHVIPLCCVLIIWFNNALNIRNICVDVDCSITITANWAHAHTHNHTQMENVNNSTLHRITAVWWHMRHMTQRRWQRRRPLVMRCSIL